MKNFILLLVSFFFFAQIYSQTNYWEGNSTNWHNPANWSLNHVPNSAEDATIPAVGVTYFPNVYSGNAECKNLTIVGGANVELFNGISFHVYGDANISGSIIIADELTFIYFHDDVFWWSGSQCVNNSPSAYGSTIYIYDDWNFEPGSNVVLDKVNVTFAPAGSSSSIIECNSATSSFYTLSMLKSAASSILLSGSSTEAMQVTNKLTIGANNNFYSYSNYDLVVYKHFDNNGHFYFVNGNLIIDDCDYNFHFNTGDFVNNLNMTTNSGYVAIVGDATVNGDIEINGVGADVWNTLFLGGDYDNNSGGTDIDSIRIIGDGIQNIYNLDCNTLILDKPSGEMRFPAETSTCDHYDWVQGMYRVNGGTFTINDLVDNGIFGTISVTSGQLNIHQDAGQFVDMNATFFMTGGNCNIYGGGYESYWSYADDASITMSGGTLDFVDNGIRVYNTASHTFSENITGGTIRTPYHFKVYRDNFNPIGGLVQLYGTPDVSIIQVAGSNFYNLEIDKTSKNYISTSIIHKSRDGEEIVFSKSNGVIANTDIDINGDFTLAAGSFSAPSIINVGGNWDNQVGESGFFEVFGLVVFDGGEQAVINSSETFYNLEIDKTYANFEGVELNNGITVNVRNDLEITDGTLELNTNSTLDVDRNVHIADGAGLNAYVDTGLEINIGGDFTDDNTTNNTVKGYTPGTEIIMFDGAGEQFITTTAPQEEFGNLIIDKASGAFRPNDNIYVLHGFTLDNGEWADNVNGLSHSFEQDFTVNTGGYFSNAVNKNTVNFVSDKDGEIHFASSGTSNGLFNAVIVDKTATKAFAPNSGEIPTTGNPDGGKAPMSQTLTLTSNVFCGYNGGLTVQNATLDLNGHTFTSTGDMAVNAGGTVDVGAGSVLKIDEGNTLDINSGGTLALMGNSGNPATVTHYNPGYFAFNVNNGGTLSAEYAVIEYVNDWGVYVKSGASLDPSHAFDYCTFQNVQSGAMASDISFYNDQDLTCTGVDFPDNPGYNVWKSNNAGNVTFNAATGDFAGAEYEYDPNGHIFWGDMDAELQLSVMLEGPYNGSTMNIYLYSLGLIPLNQPFDTEPTAMWYYTGTESVAAIPPNVVDWVLVQLRDASDAASANETTVVIQKAGFLLNNGSVVDLDGTSNMAFTGISYSKGLFPVVFHRNHLGVISETKITRSGGLYSYDFTAAGSAHSNTNAGEKDLGGGVYGLWGGDSNGSGLVANGDLSNDWKPHAGEKGYMPADYNLDGQIENKDKNDVWADDLWKASQIPTFTCGDALFDSRDGQSYATIQIGAQCWMAENLNVGTMINGSGSQTDNGTIEKYCYDDNTANCDTYGGLYQWDEMMQYVTTEGTQGICPTGWHLPTNDEWKTMEMYLGMSQTQADATGWRGTDEGGKLKETGTSHWTSPNTSATNSSGFTGLPGGYRDLNGSFNSLTYYAFFWSSSEDACHRRLFYSSAQVYRNSTVKAYGFSVRCVSD